MEFFTELERVTAIYLAGMKAAAGQIADGQAKDAHTDSRQSLIDNALASGRTGSSVSAAAPIAPATGYGNTDADFAIRAKARGWTHPIDPASPLVQSLRKRIAAPNYGDTDDTTHNDPRHTPYSQQRPK